MKSWVRSVAIVIGVLLALPVVGYAQEARVSGIVTDTTGAVLPGVTVTALHEASGNTFETVTDERGAYLIPVRIGVYQVTAQLPGFQTVVRSGLELLAGQQVVTNFQMAIATLQESVTVTAETPLIDVTSSSVGGNIDSRQVSELPVNGRNWMDLSMLAPGSRTNAVDSTGNTPTPTGSVASRGRYQLNLDGQQITNYVVFDRGNPRYSRDAIAEFEFVSNRFDATQGRSTGVQVNAVTKSGTNTMTGTFSSFFRDDSLNARDPVVKRVLPFSNQQLSTTFGGPIRRDRIHVFGNYEYEREPSTTVFTTPYPRFNLDLAGSRREHLGGMRLDVQFSPQTRGWVRGNKWVFRKPLSVGGATITPANNTGRDFDSNQLFGALTHVLSNRAVNEIKVGYAGVSWDDTTLVKNPNALLTGGFGSPVIQLRGLTIGTGRFTPQNFTQETYSVRDDLTFSFTTRGRHDLKLGGEFLYTDMDWFFCNLCNGNLDARGGPIPANIEDLFPDLFDFSTWNLAPLSPITARWTKTVGRFGFPLPRRVYSAWIQDDWAITSRLTLNLGVRYDLHDNAFANDIAIPPFLPGNRPNDTDNVAPRLGFAFRLMDRTVVRGGFGKFFGDVINHHFTQAWSAQISPETPNDGRPDFAANPNTGPEPTVASLEPRLCSTALVPGCIRREITFPITNPDATVPYSYQASIGVQRQLTDIMAVEMDYTFTGDRAVGSVNPAPNINLTFNPATGANYPFRDISRRPFPDWGRVHVYTQREARSNYHALQTVFTKRLSRGWQASGTYLLSVVRDAFGLPLSGLEPVNFPLAPDFGGDYTKAASDQRHRVVFNGIWQVGLGFQLSGLYFFGSGERFATNFGADLRDIGGGIGGEDRLRADGTIMPRNNLVGRAIHRIDLRAQQRFRLFGRLSVDGIVEVFNLFNRANFGSYTTTELNPRYGRPSPNPNVAYSPRTVQLGFRVAF